MLIEIMQANDKRNNRRVRISCENTPILCEFLGWFDKLLGMKEFYEVEPLVIIGANDTCETVNFAFIKNDNIEMEIDGVMERCGFELLMEKIRGVIRMKSYIFKFKNK